MIIFGENTIEFETNVFINCPFDNDYIDLLCPLLFTVLYLGMTPRIATERSDSGEIRINKICELISDSKFGIHDISRLKSKVANEYFRLNMSFELGLDYAGKRYGSEQLKQKQLLILEKEPYDYQKSLSDISGMDIKSHENEPTKLVCEVRNWFYETVGLRNAEDFIVIWWRYTEFLGFLDTRLEEKGMNQKEAIETLKIMPIKEFIDLGIQWIQNPSHNFT